MPVVPIKELKDTAAFAKKVEESGGELVVTRNGREAFVAVTMEHLEALKLEAVRAELYRRMSEAEEEEASGMTVDARESQHAIRERYGL